MPRPRESCAKCPATTASGEEIQKELGADMLRVVREQNLHLSEWAQRVERRLLQQLEKHLEVVTEMLQDLQSALHQSGLQAKVEETVTAGEQSIDSEMLRLGRSQKQTSTTLAHTCSCSSWRTPVVTSRVLKCQVSESALSQQFEGTLSEDEDHRSVLEGHCYGMDILGPDMSASFAEHTPSCLPAVTQQSSSPTCPSSQPGSISQSHRGAAAKLASFDSNRCTDLTPHIRLDDNPHLRRLQKKKSVTVPFADMRRRGIGLKREDKRWTVLQVEGRPFKMFTVILICLNTIFVGLESDTDVRMALEDPLGRIPATFATINRCFAALFFMELLMRLVAYRIKFFVGHDWKWNAFDTLMILSQFVEELLAGSNVSSARIIRIFRLVRTLRIVRVLHTFRNLRKMVSCMFNSMSALVWALMLLSTVMYLFAIIFVQAAATHFRVRAGDDTAPSFATFTALRSVAGRDNMPEEELLESLVTNFRTLYRTLLTMLMCISNGVDWYTVVQPLFNISPLYVLLFAIYVVFVLFGVLNVLFACFVEQALQVNDRDLLIQAELARTESFLRDMQELFREADIDASNFMTLDELANYLQDERVMAYMQGHQLDVSDVTAMFELLDVDNSGAIDMHEFLIGTWRLKGTARCLDIMRIFQCLQHLEEQLAGVQENLGVQRAPAPVRSLLQTTRRSKSQTSQIRDSPAEPPPLEGIFEGGTPRRFGR